MAEKQQYTIYKTKFELSPATPEEQGFCFSHEKSAVDEACIGHLRGDFGDTGTAFYHSWWPHNQQLVTPTFKRELEDVMTGLRRNGLLKDRKTMLARSMRFRTAIIPGEGRNTMAFRIETQEHLFYLRCNPNKGEYNFYCYGYNKTMLMEVLRQQKQLPRVAQETFGSLNGGAQRSAPQGARPQAPQGAPRQRPQSAPAQNVPGAETPNGAPGGNI